MVDNADLEVLVYERELGQLVADALDGLVLDRTLHLVVLEDGSPVTPTRW